MKLEKVEFKINITGNGYTVNTSDRYCITGPNGYGKTVMLTFAHALSELLLTGSDLALVNALCEDKEHSLFGGTTRVWHDVIDQMKITTEDGKVASISAVEPLKGKFAINNNGETFDLNSRAKLNNYTPVIPFLGMERHSQGGVVLADLVSMNGGELCNKQDIEELCVHVLGLDAAPRFFYEMPLERNSKGRKQWINELEKWQDTFSHGELEMIRLALSLSIAKRSNGLIFIDGAENGLHILSQQELAKRLEYYNAMGIQIIFTTYSPSCLTKGHCFDLYEGEEY